MFNLSFEILFKKQVWHMHNKWNKIRLQLYTGYDYTSDIYGVYYALAICLSCFFRILLIFAVFLT